MSLNWKEIDLILEELDLAGYQIQKAIQAAFDVLCLKLHGKQGTKNILIALTPNACRIHETFSSIPKSDRPLRFAEFLNSRIGNGWIEEAVQLGDNRIVRLTVHCGERGGPSERVYRIYIRLWSNAANVIVTDEAGAILDAMRRLPKRGEATGGRYAPEEALGSGAAAQAAGGRAAVLPVAALVLQPAMAITAQAAALAVTEAAANTVTDAAANAAKRPKKEYFVREIAGEAGFNQKIDAFYAEQGGALSLGSLKEQAAKVFEARMTRLQASLDKLAEKEADFASADRFKQYGDIILANMASIRGGDTWLEAENFYSGGLVRIALDPKQTAAAQAEAYYEQYRKAKSGLDDVRAEIAAGKAGLERLEAALAALLAETNPLVLQKKLKTGGGVQAVPAQMRRQDQKRPGLSFRRGDWLLIVGRDAAENDDLLRHYVKGGDLWFHARDFPGSYVFVKQRSGK